MGATTAWATQQNMALKLYLLYCCQVIYASIAKWMRDECGKKCAELGKPVINHFFDLWHIGKSMQKQ